MDSGGLLGRFRGRDQRPGSRRQEAENRIAEIETHIGMPIRARVLARVWERGEDPDTDGVWVLLLVTDDGLHVYGEKQPNWFARILGERPTDPQLVSIPFSALHGIDRDSPPGFLARLFPSPVRRFTLHRTDGESVVLEVDRAQGSIVDTIAEAIQPE